MAPLVHTLANAIGERIDSPPVLDLVVEHQLVIVYEDGLSLLESPSGLTLAYEEQVVREAIVNREFPAELMPGITMRSDREAVRASMGPPADTLEAGTTTFRGRELYRAGWDAYQLEDITLTWHYHNEGGLHMVSLQRAGEDG